MPDAVAESSGYRVMPGIAEILPRLAEAGIVQGIVTGNVEPAARIKLARGDLDKYFTFGGYGSDDRDRVKVTERAIERGARGGRRAARPRRDDLGRRHPPRRHRRPRRRHPRRRRRHRRLLGRRAGRGRRRLGDRRRHRWLPGLTSTTWLRLRRVRDRIDREYAQPLNVEALGRERRHVGRAPQPPVPPRLRRAALLAT